MTSFQNAIYIKAGMVEILAANMYHAWRMTTEEPKHLHGWHNLPEREADTELMFGSREHWRKEAIKQIENGYDMYLSIIEDIEKSPES